MTPAGTSNELDIQNEWEESHTHTHCGPVFPLPTSVCTYMCKDLEFRVRLEAFYGITMEKERIYTADEIENAGLSLRYIGV